MTAWLKPAFLQLLVVFLPAIGTGASGWRAAASGVANGPSQVAWIPKQEEQRRGGLIAGIPAAALVFLQ